MDNIIIEKAFSDIVENAEKIAEAEAQEDDYTVNGLRYCGKCQAPKQAVIKIEGAFNGKVVPVKCDCSKLEEEAEREAEKKRKISQEIKGFFGKRAVRTFKTDEDPDSPPSRLCRRYAQAFAKDFKPNGNGLLIYGNRGTGKTGYADSIAYELMSEGFKAVRIDILQYCSNEENKAEAEALQTLKRADIVILDGIGKEPSNVKNATSICTLVNMLRDNNTPIIAVTDIPLEIIKSESELKKIKREAYMNTFATLRACTYPVHCVNDFLTQAIKTNFLSMRELLEREA